MPRSAMCDLRSCGIPVVPRPTPPTHPTTTAEGTTIAPPPPTDWFCVFLRAAQDSAIVLYGMRLREPESRCPTERLRARAIAPRVRLPVGGAHPHSRACYDSAFHGKRPELDVS